ncbi:MAG: tetratricopeptide repeat protein [Bacteroidota bacterium]
MHRLKILTLFNLLVLFLLFSQNKVIAATDFIDFKTDSDIHSKSQKALVLWERYVSNSIDSLNILGIELLRSAKKKESDFGLAIANRILGCYDVRTGKIDRGIILLTRSKNYFVSTNDNELICEGMNELGIAYFLSGDLETAKRFFQSSLKFGKDSPVETNCFLAQINLAKVYTEKGKISEAKFLIVDYIQQAIALKKWESVGNGYSLLGNLALERNQIRTAKIYFDKQISFAKKAHSDIYITRAINNQAILAYYEGNSNKSLTLFQEVLKRRKIEKFAFNIYDAFFNMARFHYPDKLDIALEYIDSCYQISKENILLKQELEVYEWRYEHYKDSHNKNLIDSMKTIITDLEKQNESVRKELEIIDYRKKSNSSNTWLFWSFGSLAIILISRYLIVRKSRLKMN